MPVKIKVVEIKRVFRFWRPAGWPLGGGTEIIAVFGDALKLFKHLRYNEIKIGFQIIVGARAGWEGHLLQRGGLLGARGGARGGCAASSMALSWETG